ncbi:MAG: formate hydrogenlyase complex iron-sulfur subunit [Calditrichia bacterium]
MKIPKIKELKEAISAIIQGPYTHPFPAEPTPVPENLRAAPKYDPDYCIGCGACAEMCPARAIKVEEFRKNGQTIRKLICNYGNCIFCGECEYHCTTEKGIHLTPQYELSYFEPEEALESIEHELVTCEMCQQIIAPKAQLNYLSRQLGPIAWSNPTVYLTETKEQGILPKFSVPPDREVWRWDLVRILCPACRRKVLLKEQWGY